ncbi:MAG: GNAT family N-acetyltransferase [Firmicutes bacterium]|nr:GNAT family N-acetyltransferase [Bacillota bacterium]
MNTIYYIQIQKENEKHIQDAKSLWLPFTAEMKEHRDEHYDVTQVTDNLMKRIGIQRLRDTMHFELMYVNDECIGICNFAIDLGGIKGLIDKGYGYIMGLYIAKDRRRLGYGRMFFQHIENVLKADGANHIYLTPDEVTGLPFWESVGFIDSHLIDPDEKLPIFIKLVV